MDFFATVAFLAGVLVMYWSMPLGCLLYRVRFLSFQGKRDDMYQWARLVASCFGVTLRKVGSHELHRTTAPVMYVANHRCWADFFLDVYLTEGRAAILSRWAVYPVFPLFLTSAMLIKGVIFFNRNRVPDKSKFNAFLDACMASSPISGLLIYPEGHRSTLPTSLPLRRGMLHFAHSRKMPVQVIITKGKEQVLSEKKLRAGFGARLFVGYSPVVQSADYPDFELFVAKLQSTWDSTWKEVYAAGDSCPVLVTRGEEGTDFPFSMKVLQGAYSVLAVSLLLAVAVLCLRIACLSVYSMALSAGLATLVAVAIQKAAHPAVTM